MHSAATAEETLEILWGNYLTLSERVDLESMAPETLETHVEANSPVHPLRIAAWLARQGYFIAAWALWEFYARSICQDLVISQKKTRSESTVDWVGRSLAKNDVDFSDQDWFASAISLRNLITHYGARAVGARAEELLEQSQEAFPDIDAYKDGYVALEHSHVAELQYRIEEFIRNTILSS